MNKRRLSSTGATLAAFGILATGCTVSSGPDLMGNLSLIGTRVTPLDL
jgi:hypothetical protein